MKPTAAPARFPYAHDSLAKVWQRQALWEFNRQPWQDRKGKTAKQFAEQSQ